MNHPASCRPASTSRWFRLNVKVHRWTSVIATLPFLVLCLTGAVLIFHEEIDTALGVMPTDAVAGESIQPLISIAVGASHRTASRASDGGSVSSMRSLGIEGSSVPAMTVRNPGRTVFAW